MSKRKCLKAKDRKLDDAIVAVDSSVNSSEMDDGSGC